MMSCVWANGCAIHYFDPATGTEHLWGFGHMKMKVAAPNEGLKAVVHGTEVVGLAVGSLKQQGYLSAGFQRRQQLYILGEDTAIRFEWPDSNFFNVRVGSEFPGVFSPNVTDELGNQEQEKR